MAVSISGDGAVTGVASINTDVSSTELGYLDGVTSAIQPQIAAQGTWQSWTPTCGNITVGNGTLAGSYTQIGKTVTCRFNFLLGSTSAVSGVPDLIPPVPMSAAMVGMAWIGSINDNGTVTYTLYALNQGGSFRLYALDASAASLKYVGIGATVPMTWANLDWMRFTATYEAA